MGRFGKELAPPVRHTSGATSQPVTPVITALQPVTPTIERTVIVQSGQKQVSDLLAKIRPEFSNLSNRNGNPATVLNRLASKFLALDEMVAHFTPERLGQMTMDAVGEVRAKYDAVLAAWKDKEAAA